MRGGPARAVVVVDGFLRDMDGYDMVWKAVRLVAQFLVMVTFLMIVTMCISAFSIYPRRAHGALYVHNDPEEHYSQTQSTSPHLVSISSTNRPSVLLSHWSRYESCLLVETRATPL